jgi:diaminohydroxyphosphoribosylaminopyrimidine deaminase/5-amino-6-(5-phosphoribosylamino)uracil reductase
MVGAVIVRQDGTVVGQGYHEKAGGPHAEVRALDEAGALAEGGTLYCTLEPCSHTGRTGPCVERVAAAKIARVVVASQDPNPLVSGRGFEFLRRQGITVDVGIMREQALRLNRPYITFITEHRPFVIIKAATSLDNRIAGRPGERTQLSSNDSQRHAHAIRAEIDAIAVGSETLLVDDPMLTARLVHRARPLTRVVFDRRLRTSAASRVFSTLAAGPVIIMTTPESIDRDPSKARKLQDAGATLEPIHRGDLRHGLTRLADGGIVSLLVEGGVTLQRAIWDEGLVDAVHLYIAPITLGPGGVAWLDSTTLPVTTLADRRVTACGPDVFMEGYVHRID